MNKEQLDYIENNIDHAESIGALSFGWADNVRELVKEMRKDKRVLLTIAEVLSVTESQKLLNSEIEQLQDQVLHLKQVNRLQLIENERLVKERDEARRNLGKAAMEIEVAGPVDHRIRVLKKELSEENERLRAALENALRFAAQHVNHYWIHSAPAGDFAELAKIISESLKCNIGGAQ